MCVTHVDILYPMRSNMLVKPSWKSPPIVGSSIITSRATMKFNYVKRIDWLFAFAPLYWFIHTQRKPIKPLINFEGYKNFRFRDPSLFVLMTIFLRFYYSLEVVKNNPDRHAKIKMWAPKNIKLFVSMICTHPRDNSLFSRSSLLGMY